MVLEEGAEAEVWDAVALRRRGRGLVNAVVELVVGQNARLRFVGAQDLDEKTWVFGTQRADVGRDGSLDWVALGFGSANGKVFHGDEARRRGRARAASPAPTPRAAASTSTSTPCRSTRRPTRRRDLAFRGILADRSSAVWRGMIKVDPGAQQTDAFQESRNLLLSKRAHADAIPGLEILANDVRCTHAAAIAQIDHEQLFYLRSRGLPEASREAPGHRGLPAGARRALRGRPGARGRRRGARAPPGRRPGRLAGGRRVAARVADGDPRGPRVRCYAGTTFWLRWNAFSGS